MTSSSFVQSGDRGQGMEPSVFRHHKLGDNPSCERKKEANIQRVFEEIDLERGNRHREAYGL